MTNKPNLTNNPDKLVVLAFSGGLDTSFCVPYLIEQGYQVVTQFVDSGGVSKSEKLAIKNRALELGALEHYEVNIAEQLWQTVITPLIKAGQWYQNQYPLLCSDRYLIVETCLKLCDELGTKKFAHGCTGMGNDQVRFDLAVQCLGDYEIISPIREIQKLSSQVREYEKGFLAEKGFGYSDKVSQYSVNENLMGATISGSEIDQWQAPGKDSYVLTAQPDNQSLAVQNISMTFEQGQLVSFNDTSIGEKASEGTITAEILMQQLNQLGGKYAIGRDIYTGDTTIGLKGRIVFEAPAISLLATAHQALEQSVLSKHQNRFKQLVANQWSQLVYEGFFYDPLKQDLEAFLNSSQSQVSGKVTLQLSQGQAIAIAIDSPQILQDSDSVYAQSASWNIEEAQGFIKLFGQSATMAAKKQLTAGAA